MRPGRKWPRALQSSTVPPPIFLPVLRDFHPEAPQEQAGETLRPRGGGFEQLIWGRRYDQTAEGGRDADSGGWGQAVSSALMSALVRLAGLWDPLDPVRWG